MTHTRTTWKDSFLDRFINASPTQDAAATRASITAATASGSLSRPMEEPPSSTLPAETARAQKKGPCGSGCRGHLAGDHFPDHSICPKSSISSRPQVARLLSMIREAPTTPTSEPPCLTTLTPSSSNSTASPATPSSRRHSLYFPSETRPFYDDGEDYDRGRGRGRKSSECAMFRHGTYRGLSPRIPMDASLEKA